MKVVRLIALQLLVLALTAIVLVAADRVTGYLLPSLQLARQLYPPHAEVSMKTPEFAYTAHINGQGFRDRDFPPPTHGRTRVLAIGDSFTFGWGVEIDKTWVKRVERAQQSGGLAIDIANLGKPGSGPAEYASVADAAVDVLRPNLILVALQQTDDLQQAVPDPVFAGLLKSLGRTTLTALAGNLLRQAFPNFLLLLSGRTVESLNWGSTVKRILTVLNDSDRQRFETLDPEVKRMYLDGALNPGLLVVASKAPDYYVEPSDLTSQRMGARINALVAQLESIKRSAARSKAEVVVVSLPNRAYVSEADVANIGRLGFTRRAGMADWNGPDEVIRDVAARAGLRSIFVTDGFRRQCRLTPCYFTFDDHFNETGQQVFADLVGKALAANMALEPPRK